MARQFYLQNNFTGGQVTPRLGLRSDFVRYKNGAATIQNMTILPQGALTSRLGFLRKNDVKDSSQESRLIPFEVSTDIAYIIEVGENYFRFYRDGVQIRETAQDITDITGANPAVVTYSGSDTYANGDRVFITGVVGMTEVNNREFTVANVDTGANTFELSGVDSSAYTAYSSGGSVEEIYELAHSYQEEDLSALRYTQSADVLFIYHGNYPTQELRRTADTSWAIIESPTEDGPYLEIDTSDITLSLSGTSGSVTVTASSALFAATDTSGTGGTGDYDRHLRIQELSAKRSITNITQATECRLTYSGDDSFAAGDTIVITGVGGMTELNDKTFEIDRVNAGSNYIYLKDTDSTGFTAYTSGGDIQLLRSKWIWLKITGYTSTTVVTAEVQDDEIFGTTGDFINFRLGAWSSTTGFPFMGTFFENRLVSCRTVGKPDTLWASAQDDYTLHAPSTDDDQAWSFSLLSNKLDAIQWISAQKQLRVGTAGSEYSIQGGTSESAVTPTSINVKRETTNGCAFVDPILVQNSTLFLQRAGRKLREFVYSFDTDGFVSPDLTLAAEDQTRGVIKEMIHQSEPDGVIWSRDANGKLIGLTYMRDQDVVGWHSHVIGGTGAKVKSLAVIPTTDQDQVWAIIERTINGATVKSIEVLGSQYVDQTINDAVIMDSSLSFLGETPSSTLTPAAVTGTGITFTAGSSVFSASDVGREIRSGSGKAIITGYTSGTVVEASIVSDFAGTSSIQSGDWTLSSDTITGINHLEGEEVVILADGGVHPNRTVSGGSITLNGQYTTVHVGLGYTQRVVSLDIEGGTTLGTSLGSRSRITTLVMRFFETVGCKFRVNNGTLQPLDFRKPSDLQDEGVPLFTGEKEVRPPRGWGDSNVVEIVQDQPLPMTLLGYVAKLQVSDAT